jgi:hypothetical protein
MKYKKFILFQYQSHYPAGGLGDIKGSFDSLQEAKDAAGKQHFDYTEIVDRYTWEIVWEKD